jgi:hypothetical protein
MVQERKKAQLLINAEASLFYIERKGKEKKRAIHSFYKPIIRRRKGEKIFIPLLIEQVTR